MDSQKFSSRMVCLMVTFLMATWVPVRAQERGCSAAPIPPNLLGDSNFDCGPGAHTFYTEYILSSVDIGPTYYDVRVDPEGWNPFFCGCCRDHHTPGDSNHYMMVVDGVSNYLILWAQEFNVRKNTTYRIKYWLQTLTNGQGPTIITRIRREAPLPVTYLPDVSRIPYGDVYCEWQTHEDLWYSGDNTRITLMFLNDEGAPNGNDFALDDLEFTVPFHHGDVNCDGVVDGSDIPAFMLALTNPASYISTYLGCDIKSADFTNDGIVSIADIDGLVTCILNGGC